MNIDHEEQGFVIAQQLRALAGVKSSFIESHAQLPLGMQEIVNAVLEPERAEATRQVINGHLPSLRLYKLALNNLSSYQNEALVAASTSLSDNKILSNRRSKDYHFKLIADPTSDEDGFILINFHQTSIERLKAADHDIHKGLFLHCEWHENFYFKHVERVSDNTFQTIVSLKDDISRALSDSSSRLYLSFPS